MVMPKRNPEHTAATSNAAQPLRMPILACAMHADEGALRSGVEVATIIKSISFGSSPAEEIGGEAIKSWKEAVRSNPADTQTAKLLATVYLWLGQTNEHQAICRKLFDLAAHSKDPVVHDCAAKAYLLQAHPDPELLKLAVASGRQALKLSTPGDINRAWFLITAAMAAVREGKPAEAEPLLTESLNLPGDTPDRQGLALAYRAMARAQLGRTDEARTDFAALE